MGAMERRKGLEGVAGSQSRETASDGLPAAATQRGKREGIAFFNPQSLIPNPSPCFPATWNATARKPNRWRRRRRRVKAGGIAGGWRGGTTRILPSPADCCPAGCGSTFYNIYAYCRWADDLADESGDPQRSLALLDWWEQQLHACYRGQAIHPVFIALARHHPQVRHSRRTPSSICWWPFARTSGCGVTRTSANC